MCENVCKAVKGDLVSWAPAVLSHSSRHRVKFAKAQVHGSASGFDNSIFEGRSQPLSCTEIDSPLSGRTDGASLENVFFFSFLTFLYPGEVANEEAASQGNDLWEF